MRVKYKSSHSNILQSKDSRATQQSINATLKCHFEDCYLGESHSTMTINNFNHNIFHVKYCYSSNKVTQQSNKA